MTRTGRPATPTALKIVKGVRKDRINTREPVPKEAEITPPAYLSDAARAVWDELAPDLVRGRVLTLWDAALFAGFCDAVARHREAAEHLDSEGAVIEGALGGARKSPWWQIWRDSSQVAARLGGLYGLTPSDRSRISIDKSEKGPAARLLTGGTK